MARSIRDRALEQSFAMLQSAKQSLRRVPEPFRTVVIVVSAQGVIENGGLRYFFESNWPGKPPYSLFSDAYRAIGAKKQAQTLDRAAAKFELDEPHRNQTLRRRWLDAHHSKLDRLDDVFFGEAVDDALDAFIEAHTADFTPPKARRR